MSIRLITPTELREQLEHCAIIDARRTTEYRAGHIPGAISMQWDDWCESPETEFPALTAAGYWGKLAHSDSSQIAARLTDAGLANNLPIVVYADGTRSKGRDGRIAWMLLYFGAKQVLLLNGGWEGWSRDVGSIETSTHGSPRLRSEKFSVTLQPQRRVLLEDLISQLASPNPPVLIDTRTVPEFAGRKYRYQPRMGRLPGAVNIPFKAMFIDDDLFVSAAHFRSLLANEHIDSKKAPVTYCEVGVRAATFALLYELYLGEVVPVFDGSLMEWSTKPELTILRD